MNTIVCIKQTAILSEGPQITPDGQLDVSGLHRHINEWDLYALEEALRIQKEHGGEVLAITIGPEEAKEAMVHAVAAGANEALHITCPGECTKDGWQIAKMLSAEIKKRSFDLVLTGVQAEDDGYGQVGAALAFILDIPHASMVIKIEDIPAQDSIVVKRELEEGYMETMKLRLPALLTIQTGINQPRYVSTMRMRRFRQSSAIKKTDVDALGLPAELLTAKTVIRRFFPPPQRSGEMEMIEGPPDTAADRLINIMKDKGVL